MTERQGKNPRGTINRPIKLHWGQQVVLGVAALGLIGTGWWAQIIDHHGGAGTVAFVVTGAAVGVVATVGRFPNRISGKDYTAEFDAEVAKVAQEKANEEVQRGADEFVGAIPPDALPVLQSAVDEYKGVTVGTTTVMEAVGQSIDEREQFEQECRKYLHNACAALTPGYGELTVRDHGTTDPAVGNAAIGSNYGSLIIEFRVNLTSNAAMHTVAAYLEWSRKSTEPSRLLILTKSASQSSFEIADSMFDVTHYRPIVQLPPRNRVGAVTEAVERALDNLRLDAGKYG